MSGAFAQICSPRWITLEEEWQQGNDKRPCVTVLLPTHNRPQQQFFGRALDSICQQTFSDFELLVLLNGASEQLQQAYHPYQHRDNRMRWIELSQAGLAAALNEGIRQAKGKYLWIMEDDDWNDPQFLQTMVEALEPRDVAMAYCLQREAGDNRWDCPPRFDPDALRTQNYIQHPMRLARTALVRRVGGVSEELVGATDYDLNLRLAPFGAYQVNRVLSVHVWHSDNLCLQHEGLQADQQWIAQQLSDGFYERISLAVQYDLPASSVTHPVAFEDQQQVSPIEGPSITYVTPALGVGGGARVILHHVHGLLERGLPVQLFTLNRAPGWMPVTAPIRVFQSSKELVSQLRLQRGIKIATWWETVELVVQGATSEDSLVYLVQDIESSYYPEQTSQALQVLQTYSSTFQYLAGGAWVQQKLLDLFGLESERITPGVDEVFFQSSSRSRERSLLVFERSQQMKNYTVVQQSLQVLNSLDRSVRVNIVPASGNLSDVMLSELYAQSGVFLQPSTHEGYCLPVLEAMAAGCPVVTTHCNGNRFCEDGINCLLVPTHDSGLMAYAVKKILDQPSLADRLVRAAYNTAEEHRWQPQLDRLAYLFLHNPALSTPAGDR